MHNFSRTSRRVADWWILTVLVGAAAVSNVFAQAGASGKNYKPGEYELFNEVVKDVNANNFAKAITDLDTWSQKVPETDFRNERAFYYVRAYSGANQPAKVLELASQLLAKDLKATYTPFEALTIYGLAAFSLRQLPAPTAEQLSIGEKAAQEEIAFLPVYFVAANKPANVNDDQWNQARMKVESDARAALLYAAMVPGAQAKAKKDYEAAEKAFAAALQKYPDCPQIAYELGGVEIAQYKANPDKYQTGLFHIARSLSLDGAKWDAAPVQKAAEQYLDKAYTQYHGADAEGLKQLKETAKASAAPPAGFKIKTQTQIAQEKEAEFEKSNPQLAFWMKIKGQLADANGEQYYESSMKGAAISGQNGAKAFKGTLVEAKPACRSKELLVAISDNSHPEVVLKFETALTGKPVTGSEIQFDGAPSAFTKDPFQLTMMVEKAQVENLKMEPCTAAPPRTGTKKSVATKK